MTLKDKAKDKTKDRDKDGVKDVLEADGENSFKRYTAMCNQLKCKVGEMVAILSTSREKKAAAVKNSAEQLVETKNKGSSIFSLGNSVTPKNYVGVLDISCISHRGSDDIMRRLEGKFKKDKVTAWREGEGKVRCRRGRLEFELEIVKLELLHYIRLKLLQGSGREYKDYVHSMLSEL